MKESGNKIKPMVKEPSITQTAMSMRDNGLKIRQTGMASIPTPTELNTQVSGRMISSMVTEFKSGWMGKNMRENIKMVQKLETEC